MVGGSESFANFSSENLPVSQSTCRFQKMLRSCILFLALGLTNAAATDADGESMWGHVYLEDSTSFEFFRATFGGKFPCNDDGSEVVLDPVQTTVINDDDKDPLLLGDGCEAPTESVEGKFTIVLRGTCSFNDKAIVAQKAGALGIIVVNNAPGLLRMPPGVLKQKKNFDVTIPAVMITNLQGRMLYKFLLRDPLQRVRLIGETSTKGKLLRVGHCTKKSMEVNADGSIRERSDSAVKIIEGGVLHLDGKYGNGEGDGDAQKHTYEFLRGMFGGPLPRHPMPVVVADPIDGCSPIANTEAVAGKLAVVVRGQCMFTNKGTNVEKAGALGMIVINRDTLDITRMWAGEREMRAITIPSVMVTGATGDALMASIKEDPDQGILMRASSVKNEHWQQIAKFLKISDWPEDDDERELLFNKLVEIHDPEQSAVGHRERLILLTNSFEKAETYYEKSSVDV
jgi:hypothetical protein